VKGCEENKEVSKDVIRAELIEALGKKGGKISEVSRIIAKKYGLSRNKVYDEALKLKRKLRGE
jgi:transcriptional regulator of acetoin/glycerol metabolism